MAKYSLGKNVGTTDKTTHQRVAPQAGEDQALAFRGTPGDVKKIRMPDVVIQKWQGDTYISNPSPTLAPKLELPSLRGVLAEPNRDFARLADALGTFNKQLVNFSTTNLDYETKRTEYARQEADAIIKQTAVEGTSSQKLGNLTAELERIIGDENSSKDDISYAERTLDRIRSDSRLGPAIESKYREEAVLNRAYTLDSAAKTELVKTTKLVDGEQVEVEVPVHTLSPNDPLYLQWANDYVFNDDSRQLTSFEYKNIKGTLSQLLSNNRTAQSKLFNTELTNKYITNVNVTTKRIGELLRDEKMTTEQAVLEIHQLIERGRYGAISGTVKKELNENLIENIIVAYLKDNNSGSAEDLYPLFNSIMTGPTESRVKTREKEITITTELEAEQYNANIGDKVTIKEAYINDNQRWISQFPAGYLEERVRDANIKLALNDEDSQRVQNGIQENLFTKVFEKEISPLLDNQIENAPLAVELLNERRDEAILAAGGDFRKIIAINNAYDKGLNGIYGVFATDFYDDRLELEAAVLEAIGDPNKVAAFNIQLEIFTEKYRHYPKARTYINSQAVKYQGLFKELETSQLKPISDLLTAARTYWINVLGKEEVRGYSNIEEQAYFGIIKQRIIEDYLSGISLDMKEDEINTYTTDYIEEFQKDSKAFIERFEINFDENAVTNQRQELPEVKVSYPGTTSEGLDSWEQTALNQGELNTETGLLNEQGRTRIRLLYESDSAMFSVAALDSILTKLVTDKEIDRRLKVIINNLPAEVRGNLGDFLIDQYQKHNRPIKPEDIEKFKNLNSIKISDASQDNRWMTYANRFSNGGVLIASSGNVSGLMSGSSDEINDLPDPVSINEPVDEFMQPKTLENIIIEMNGAMEFRGVGNPNYRKGDYRSSEEENFYFNFRPQHIQGAINRIQTLTEADLNALTIGALLEAGITDKGKFEVAANVLYRSHEFGDVPISHVLTGHHDVNPNQYEAIFNPMGRAANAKPYTIEMLEGKPDLMQLADLLGLSSSKEAAAIYYLWRARFASQQKTEE